MHGVRLLQLRVSGKEAAQAGDRLYEKDCACEPQEEIKNERKR